MGFAPAQVDAMTLWEFAAAAEGWRKAHATEDDKPPPPTAAKFEEMKSNYAKRYH